MKSPSQQYWATAEHDRYDPHSDENRLHLFGTTRTKASQSSPKVVRMRIQNNEQAYGREMPFKAPEGLYDNGHGVRALPLGYRDSESSRHLVTVARRPSDVSVTTTPYSPSPRYSNRMHSGDSSASSTYSYRPPATPSPPITSYTPKQSSLPQPIKKCPHCRLDNPVTHYPSQYVACRGVYHGVRCPGTFSVSETDARMAQEMARRGQGRYTGSISRY